MSLFEQIQKDRQAARVAQEPVASSILTVLVGEVERLKGKEAITDERIVRIIKKMISDNEQVILVSKVHGTQLLANMENELLLNYVPKQLTEEEIAVIIASNDLNSMKEVMAFMKTNYEGRYDGKMVSQLFTKGGK